MKASESIISPDDELAALPEFALLREDARSVGLVDCVPPVRRVSVATPSGEVSALRWGDAEPQLVLLHGDRQTAHTWDTTVLATGLPAVAVDLPGHGWSAWREDHDYSPARLAEQLVGVLEELAPRAGVVVGTGLGGLTALRLASEAPHLVRRLVLVDVTPTVAEREGIAERTPGPQEYPTFETMLDQVAATLTNRGREGLRRGLLQNSHRRPDGVWVWRCDPVSVGRAGGLWADAEALHIPTVLVRGGTSGLVTDADEEEFLRRVPTAEVRAVESTGHLVHAEAPVPLSRILLTAAAG